MKRIIIILALLPYLLAAQQNEKVYIPTTKTGAEKVKADAKVVELKAVKYAKETTVKDYKVISITIPKQPTSFGYNSSKLLSIDSLGGKTSGIRYYIYCTDQSLKETTMANDSTMYELQDYFKNFWYSNDKKMILCNYRYELYNRFLTHDEAVRLSKVTGVELINRKQWDNIWESKAFEHHWKEVVEDIEKTNIIGSKNNKQ